MVRQLLDAGAASDLAAPGGVRPLHLATAGPITTASTRSKICLAHFYDQQQLWKKAGPGSSAIVKLLLAAGGLGVWVLRRSLRAALPDCWLVHPWRSHTHAATTMPRLPRPPGADQSSRTASGATGLHIAANSGSADVIADLLESSEDLDPDDDGAYNCELLS
jgi:hypothetical protein